MGQGVLSAYFPITQNQEWVIHQRVELTYWGTSTSWRKGLTGTPWSSRRKQNLTSGEEQSKAGAHPGGPPSWKANANVDTRLSMGQQCALFAKASGILGCITQNIVIRWRELILIPVQHWCVHTCKTLSSSGLLSTRHMGILVESPTKGRGDD